MLDLTGHIAYALILSGQLLVARKIRNGWLLRIAGVLIWVILGFILGLSSIWLWSIFFLICDFYGWKRWK
jgi:hypothetical protein